LDVQGLHATTARSAKTKLLHPFFVYSVGIFPELVVFLLLLVLKAEAGTHRRQ
jgi:hypothetical protein